MFVWEILNEGKLGRWEGFWARDAPRFYLSREAAEAVCLPPMEEAHKKQIKFFLSDVEHYEDPLEIFDQEDIDFWKNNPPLLVHRTDTFTFYGCGDPEADSRDYQCAAYGWIKRREVVE
jgi:hypothetical protein